MRRAARGAAVVVVAIGVLVVGLERHALPTRIEVAFGNPVQVQATVTGHSDRWDHTRRSCHDSRWVHVEWFQQTIVRGKFETCDPEDEPVGSRHTVWAAEGRELLSRWCPGHERAIVIMQVLFAAFLGIAVVGLVRSGQRYTRILRSPVPALVVGGRVVEVHPRGRELTIATQQPLTTAGRPLRLTTVGRRRPPPPPPGTDVTVLAFRLGRQGKPRGPFAITWNGPTSWGIPPRSTKR